MYANVKKNSVVMIIIVKSIKFSFKISIGRRIEDSPNTNKILNILLPIILPIAILLSFFFIANSDVASYGREVPKATMDRPITVWLTPSLVAMAILLSTTISPPMKSPVIPIRKSINDFINSDLESFLLQ